MRRKRRCLWTRFLPPAGETAAARESQRILLCARSSDGQGAAGGAVREEADVGQRNRRGRTAGAVAGKRPDRRRATGLSVGGGGGQLGVECFQSGDGIVLHVRGRVL